VADCLTPGKDPVPITGGCLGFGSGLDGFEKPFPHPASIPARPSPFVVAIAARPLMLQGILLDNIGKGRRSQLRN